MEYNGSPKPIFETDLERLSFCTTLLIHPYFLHKDGNGIVNDTVNDVPKLTKTEQTVLSYIAKDNQATIADIAFAVGKSRSTINRAIRSLKAKRILTRIGADKTGSWTIKE